MYRYQLYKPVNLNWVSEIPSHWDLVGLNILFTDNKIKNDGMKVDNILSLSYGKIIKKKGEVNFGLIPASYETYQIVYPGYIVLRLTDMQNDHTSLRVGLAKEKGIVTSAYTGLIPKIDVNSSYYYYLLHTLDITKYIYNLGGGVRQSSDYNEIKKLKFPFPPLSEQTAIANYLDAQTEKIDIIISKKQKLIELLKEQRQSIINEIFHNVNANCLKWKVSWIFKKIGSGTTPESGNASYYNGEIKWINTGDLNDGILSDCEKTVTQKALNDYSALKIYPKGALIVAMYGATIGKVSIIDFEACTNQACCVLSQYKQSEYQGDFLLFWFISNRKSLINMSFGGGQPNINQDIVRSLRIPKPSFTEQQQIVNYIKDESYKIDTAISRIEKEIELIKEYKQSLIAEVVTGKMKVN